jgi:hypothetical protein
MAKAAPRAPSGPRINKRTNRSTPARMPPLRSIRATPPRRPRLRRKTPAARKETKGGPAGSVERVGNGFGGVPRPSLAALADTQGEPRTRSASLPRAAGRSVFSLADESRHAAAMETHVGKKPAIRKKGVMRKTCVVKTSTPSAKLRWLSSTNENFVGAGTNE